jgi:trimethyllysine dioxygenase
VEIFFYFFYFFCFSLDGFAFIDGLEATEECTVRVLNRMGYMKNTVFGDFWSFSVNTEKKAESLIHADTAYTGLSIEPHTDGTYCKESPGLQCFHVLSFSSQTETAQVNSMLVDGFSVAESFQRKFPVEYELLKEVKLDWKYIDRTNTHLYALAPIVSENKGKLEQIRWNHYDRGDLRHLLDRPELLNQVYDAIEKWRQELLNSKHQIIYHLVPGKLVIFNNWRILHGRSDFHGKRHLSGCYFDRQLYLSQVSVLRDENPYDFVE